MANQHTKKKEAEITSHEISKEINAAFKEMEAAKLHFKASRVAFDKACEREKLAIDNFHKNMEDFHSKTR